jgi:molybdenum cofactor cytidylyltransferase
MARAESMCAVILAAGSSTRMGRDKALLPWPSVPPELAATQTFLSAAIRSLSPFSDMVIVVAGANEPNLLPIIYANAAFVVRNPEPERGQFSSLQVGLQSVLSRGRDAALVTLVDRPPAQVATIGELKETFVKSARDVWAIVPEFNGKHGHPVIFSREMIHHFLHAPADATARDIEHEQQAHVQYVSVSDPFVTANIDTPQDYAELQNRIGSPELHH